MATVGMTHLGTEIIEKVPRTIIQKIPPPNKTVIQKY